MTHNADKDACCACSSPPVARVVDGVFRKPVCATHRRIYAERGYLIDALTTVFPPGVGDAS